MPVSDTSTPADRQAFTNALEGAAPGPAMLALAAVVADSPAPMLGFEVSATYAQGVSRIRTRIAAGRAPL